MEDRIRPIEERLERIEAQVADLAERVRVLTQQEAPSSSRVMLVGEEAVPAEADPWSFYRLPIQVGRLFLVMAGAFGLRAVTLSAAVLDWLGVGVGLAYAAVWIGFTEVAGRKGRASDAAFHAAAVVAIAYPLLWEAAVRFGVLDPVPAAVLMLGFTALLLGVAWRGRLPMVAWIAVAAGSASGAGLTFAARDLFVAVIVLFPVAAMTLVASAERAYRGARWPAAVALDVVGLLTVWLQGRRNQEWLDPVAVSMFLLGLAGFYLAAFAWSAMARRRRVGVFTVVQTVAALAVGFEGALHVLPAGPEWVAGGGGWVGHEVLIAGLVTGIVGVAAAIVPVSLSAMAGRAAGQAWSAILGSWLVARCSAILLPAEVAGVAWVVLALLLAFAGRGDHRAAHRLLAAVLAIAAGAAAGSWRLVADVLGKASGSGGAGGWGPPSVEVAVVVVLAGWLALLGWWWRRPPDRIGSWTWTVPAFSIALAASLGAAVVMVVVVDRGMTLAGDAAAIAVAGTGTMAAVTLVAAGLARRGGRPEWRWTAVTLLVAAACKVLAQDLPRGRPATLFLSLALVGGSLLAATRLLRRGS